MKVKAVGAVLLVLGAIVLAYWVVASPVLANPGFKFTPPDTISLGNMKPSATPYSGTGAGSLVGNNANGYTVTGLAKKGSNKGKMVAGDGLEDGLDAKEESHKGKMVAGDNVLANKLKIGPSASPTPPLTFGEADTAQTFLSTSGPTDTAVPFYVSQLVASTDNVTSGYTITITFTVITK